jgi:hypothetical protein
MTAARETNIRYLETTWAVEKFCKFDQICPDLGMGSGKVLPKGEVCMIVPPVEVADNDSKSIEAKVYITFGWITLTDMDTVLKAEDMPVPAEGWAHVEARLRDLAFKMRLCDMLVDEALVKASEQTLQSKYPSAEAFHAARAEREASRVHVLMPRPVVAKPPLTAEQQVEKARKQQVAASQLYNPYEAKKRPSNPSKSLPRKTLQLTNCGLCSSGYLVCRMA